MERARLPLLFMHIPKCAGTSAFSLLRAAFDESEICPLPGDGTWSWQPDDVRGYKLICAHFSGDFLEAMGDRGTRLIMLRQPVNRVVSLYDFWRSHRWDYIRSTFPPGPYNGPTIAKSMSFSEFLESEYAAENIYNGAARQLLGRRFDSLTPDDDSAAASCRRALRDFAWIGIAERFESSISTLCRLLGLPAPVSVPRENSTYELGAAHPICEPVEKTVPSGEQRRRIEDGNRLDMAMYQEGLQISEEFLTASQ